MTKSGMVCQCGSDEDEIMVRARNIILASVVLASLLSACGQRQVSYQKDIHPILQANCATCHSQNGIGYAKSGFSVESYASLMKGTKFGPVIERGSSAQSNLVWLLEHRAHPQINMPKSCEQMTDNGKNCAVASTTAERLSDHDVSLIARWIDQGAKDN
jgi:cytochrome c553